MGDGQLLLAGGWKRAVHELGLSKFADVKREPFGADGIATWRNHLLTLDQQTFPIDGRGVPMNESCLVRRLPCAFQHPVGCGCGSKIG